MVLNIKSIDQGEQQSKHKLLLSSVKRKEDNKRKTPDTASKPLLTLKYFKSNFYRKDIVNAPRNCALCSNLILVAHKT